jgi:hypothetical protein
MAIIYALENLYNQVIARFATDGTIVANDFGWLEPGKSKAGTRITWVPGDFKGNLGKMLPPQNPGGAPRSLANLDEQFTVEIVAEDGSSPDNELAQYKAARAVFDAWFRAVYIAAHSQVTIISQEWMNTRNIRRRGAGIRVVGSVRATILDEAVAFIPSDTQAVIDVKQGAVTETDTFTAADQE